MSTEYDTFLSIPRDSWVIRADHLRHLWKDYPGFNEIFPDLLSNLDYDKCIVRAVVDFNDNLPETRFTPATFPQKSLLLKKAFAEVLSLVILYHAQNYFTGASAGVQIPVHERFQALQPMLQMVQQQAKELEVRLKRKINILNAFGFTDHVSSLGLGNRTW